MHPDDPLRRSAGGGLPAPTVDHGELRLTALGSGVGGRPVDEAHGPIRTGTRRRTGADAPLGERPRRDDGRPRSVAGAMGRCRPLGEPRGSPSSDGRIHGTPVHRRRPVNRVSSAGRLSCRRTPAVPAWTGPPGSLNRLLRQPIRRWSGRDGDADHGVAPTQRSRLRAAGRNTAARRPHGRTRDLAPGSELSRVGALEGRRTSWEGAWERPVGVDRTASRPISRLGP